MCLPFFLYYVPGFLSNAFCDLLGLCETVDAEDRDELTLCRKDSLMVTHADSIRSFRRSQQLIRDKTDPVMIAKAKKVKIAQKFVAQHNTKTVKAVEKGDAKKVEAERKRNMTPAEKKEEAVLKKKMKIEKETSIREEYQRKLVEYEQIVEEDRQRRIGEPENSIDVDDLIQMMDQSFEVTPPGTPTCIPPAGLMAWNEENM